MKKIIKTISKCLPHLLCVCVKIAKEENRDKTLIALIHNIPLTKLIYKGDHMLSHTTNFNKFKKTHHIESMFSDDNRIELEINNRQISGKIPKYLKMK